MVNIDIWGNICFRMSQIMMLMMKTMTHGKRQKGDAKMVVLIALLGRVVESFLIGIVVWL